jgi:hypothetical protein
MTTRLLCIDPGSTHLVSCIFEVNEQSVWRKVWSYMFDVSNHDPGLIARSASVMALVSGKLGVQQALIEYQAPMGLSHTCRWNAYIEGAVASCLCTAGMNVDTVHPSTAKRALRLATGNYADNKQVAFRHAKVYCADITSHHEADCFILGEWWWMNKL